MKRLLDLKRCGVRDSENPQEHHLNWNLRDRVIFDLSHLPQVIQRVHILVLELLSPEFWNITPSKNISLRKRSGIGTGLEYLSLGTNRPLSIESAAVSVHNGRIFPSKKGKLTFDVNFLFTNNTFLRFSQIISCQIYLRIASHIIVNNGRS